MAGARPRSVLAEALNAQSIDQLRRKYVLPENFAENFLKCLSAGIESLEPSLCLLSKVTFKNEHHDPLQLFALWRRVLHEFRGTAFIEANFLKAAARVCGINGLPEVLKSSVEFEACYAVLISSISCGRRLESDFLSKLASVKRRLSEIETIDLAEKLLVHNSSDWPLLIVMFPGLLGVMLVLDYGDGSFTTQVRSLSDQNERFKDILDRCQTSWLQMK
ncbi:uncharacterized protein LOC114828178 [Galendromus occidentalis]|uniref:Uncharacterized protein LOC114828178 n=1 Tax=Galendromus occidentalis TaxID=34638 RepID=A0AAJ7SEB4_9ACAR|nr:uncharacterized protein LOC114828178 [Galendromus occidentalis]